MSANFYELLKYAATGQASPDMTYFDKMRASTLMGGVVQTLTGIPPLSFKSDGSPLISWSMKGNGSQSGTPTPDNPVMPEFVGVRTGNLWNEEYPNISGTIQYIPLYVGEGSFTLSTTTPFDSSVANLFLLSGNVSTGASTSGNGAWKKHNVTAQSDSGYVTIAYRHYTGTTSPADCITMLNLGSIALPYEPYGWAEKITCTGQTTPLYLGEVSTVRRVRKLVLTGKEYWQKSSSYKGSFYVQLITDYLQLSYDAYCTHAVHAPTLSQYSKGKMVFNGGLIGNCNLWFEQFDENTTVADFKAYLASEYAAGTPVTVWYVLAEPETAIVNEPLAKIGDYADELHSTDAGVTIPTAKGQNTLTVETDLQPSEMSITYKG